MSDDKLIENKISHNPHLKHRYHQKGCETCEREKREKCDGIIKLSLSKKLKI